MSSSHSSLARLAERVEAIASEAKAVAEELRGFLEVLSEALSHLRPVAEASGAAASPGNGEGKRPRGRPKKTGPVTPPNGIASNDTDATNS
jgi:hypothetical protein